MIALEAKDSLADWLAALEKLHPTEMDFGLERVGQLADKLNLTEFTCPKILVAGTNGKGSTAALLERIYLEAGYRTGVFMSPHILNFNERVRICGKPIADMPLCHAFHYLEKHRGDISLTYFEYTLLGALYCFSQANIDILIVEVGLGGRLDAANILDADLSIITTVHYDHQHWLGETLEEIGAEKAGIFRPEQLAIFGESRAPQSVLDKAKALNVRLYQAGVDYHYQQEGTFWHYVSQELTLDHLNLPRLPMANAAIAITASQLLQDKLPITKQQLCAAITHASLLGRMQRHTNDNGTLEIIDVAHNPQSCAYLAKKLQQDANKGQTYAIVGMLKDKDVISSLAPVYPLVDAWYVCNLPSARSMDKTQLAAIIAPNTEAEIQVFNEVKCAYDRARQELGKDDRLVIFGSFFTVGEILKEQGEWQ